MLRALRLFNVNQLKQRSDFRSSAFISGRKSLPYFTCNETASKVVAVGDKQVDANVLSRYPRIQLQRLLDVKADEVFPGVNRKQWSHW